MNRVKKFAALLDKVTYCIEIAFVIIILAAVLLLLVDLAFNLGQFLFHGNTLDFDTFLSKAFTLIIGVEFTKMLCKHTAETVIEVLLFATARQIILSHTSIINTIIGISGIAILFAVKRFWVVNLQRESETMSV